MNNLLTVALIHVQINLMNLNVSFSVCGISLENLKNIPYDKPMITLSLIIVMYIIRSQDPEVVYIKYLNTLDRLTIDQLEYLVLGDLLLFN
jgi:hypothetical protein